ncbi:endonuclease III [Acetobacterium paludosum]|uniref:Endonuclease III n=1 Tax=Acetobacterium paludosum TaxID=52693 RepID=A0A923I036_9FIRM|nr:endonuclease III [Acetobacterium paludosum]MBC3887668.1 endonuclease III [Acetobacterium paludosum]
MTKKNREQVLATLESLYGLEKCGLDFDTPFELLIATILSAQCTDVRVNIVTKDLFRCYNTPKTILLLGEKGLLEKIKSCGLSNIKAKNIILTCDRLLSEYDGIVPKSMDELISLPGVGRKTANVVMSNAFDIPAIAVDTHVFRVSKRIGLAKGKTVLEVEKELMKNIPREQWSHAHHWLIWHGRRCCVARNPKCAECKLQTLCDYGKQYLKEA